MKIFTLLHKSTDKGTINLGRKSRIIPMKPLFSHYYMFTVVIMLLLGGFTSRAWGGKAYYTCTEYEDATTYGDRKKWGDNAEIHAYSFDNAVGIDSIYFTYYYKEQVIIYYSTIKDGSSGWVELCKLPAATDNPHKSHGIWLTGTAKNAQWIQFKTVKGAGSIFSGVSAQVDNFKVYRASSISLSDDSFEFGSTPKDGSTTSTVVTISTYNVNTITADSIEFSGTNASYFSVSSISSPSGTCPVTRTLTLTYSPTTEGDHSATATIHAGGKTADLSLSGSATNVVDPAYTWYGEDTYYVEDDDLDLSALWRSTSDGDIEYGFTFTPAAGVQTDANAPQLAADGHTLSIGKAGRLDLTLTQDEYTGYESGSDTKTINIVRRNPVFAWNTQTNYYYNTTVSSFVTKTSGADYTVTSSDDEIASMDGSNLKIYNKPGTVKIKYVHPQTYKWNEKKDSVTFTPGWKNDTVSFSLTDGNHTNYESANTFSSNYAYWNNDIDGYFLGATSMSEVSTKRENYAIIHFTGIPDTLYFDQKLNKYVVLPKDRVCYVMVSANGSTWNDTVWRQEAEIEYMNNQKVCLPSSTRYIKFYYNGTISSEYKNIRVSKRKYFKTDKASLDFATNVKNASCDAQTFKFHHAGAGYITSVSSSDSHFTVSPTSVTTGGEVCDSAVITVSYSTAEVGEHSGTITISDNIGNSTSVSVTGTTVDAYTPTITWPGTTSFAVGSTIANGFVAKDDNEETISGTWSFESSDSTVIDIVKGELKAICGGTATITGTIAEGATWSSGSQTKTLTVTKLSDAVTWNMPTAEDGKIHVWAESDIPSSIASANEAIDAYTSSNSANVRVSGSKGSFALRARRPGEITLTAHSEGSCMYSTAEDTKTIKVDSCAQDIIWEQNLAGLSTEEDGTISRRITLNAYAVDSNNVETGRVITYSLPANTSFASIENGNELVLTGTGSVVLTASTASDDTIYAQAQASKLVRVRVYGTGCGSEIVDKDQHAVGAYDNNKGKQYGDVTPLPPIDKIYVRVGKYSDVATQTLYIYGYNASGTETTLASYGVGSLSTSGADKELSNISEDICRIKIKAGGTISKWYSDLRITQKSYLRKSVENISNDHLFVYENVNETIRISYSDKPLLQYRYTGSNLTLTPTETVNNDCSDYGYYDFVLSGSYSRMGDYHDTIYITTTALDTLRVPVYHRVSTGGLLLFNEADGNWNESGKWSNDMLPRRENDVTISKNVIVTGEVEAYSVTIVEGGSVTINPGAGLTVGAGGITGSTTSNLILKAGTEGATKGQTGYLRISPEYASTMPNATVELYSTAYHNKNAESGSKSRYQCVGAPISDAGVRANTVYPAGTWLYTWNESTETWTNSRSSYTFVPFQGFETTQKKEVDGLGFNYEGHLVSGHDVVTIGLAYTSSEKGYNLLANSWAAPISIEKFKTGDFIDAERTVYILNAGTKNNSDSPGESIDAPGKWFGVPIKTAAELAAEGLPCVIPSMQGFWVKANSGSAQLILDYSRLVWNVDYSGYTANKPLRAPKRTSGNEDAPITGKLKVSLYSESENDYFFMLESERYDAAYEDGYDAMKIPSGSMDVFTIEGENELGVDATNSIIGTRVGVRTGEETAYTLEFSRVSAENELALRDNETNEEIDIYEGMQYTFFAEPNATLTERFEIVEREAPSITTGVDNADKKVKVHKFIKDNQVLILKNGVLYNTMGAIVR